VIRVLSVRSHSEGDDVGYIRITQFQRRPPPLEEGDQRHHRPERDKLKASSST